MEYILLTAFLGCAVAALGPRIVFALFLIVPVVWLLLMLHPWNPDGSTQAQVAQSQERPFDPDEFLRKYSPKP